jgi:hypothetical protein
MAMTEEQKAERRAARAEQRLVAEMLQAEEQARRAKAAGMRRQAKHEQYEASGVLPTRESLRVGGLPCPGCGKPYIDGSGGWPAQPTSDELAKKEAAEAEFRQIHAACDKQFGTRGWSYGGSRTSHCWECCPFPPLSDPQLATVRQHCAPTRDEAWRKHTLNVWRVTLRCGHTFERTVNKDNRNYSPNRYIAPMCPTCGDYRAERSTELVGPLSEQRQDNSPSTPPRVTKAQVSRERRKLRELQQQVAESQRRLGMLEQRLIDQS